ncbi:MAG TPA: hypothetical protein ENN33_10655 [Ignavibacteria bacterium]|nr:hypothetical protein [Ignavibacteria bacterium]
MKYIFIITIILTSFNSTLAWESDTIYVASWNVENLFDNIDDPDKNDEDFLETGNKRWTNERIFNKMKNLADVISFMNKNKGPDILGLIEIEHKYLVEKLIINFLPNRNYRVVGFDSPDSRGIDNYLMYDEDIFELIEYNKIPILFFDEEYSTRDILHVSLKYFDEIIDVFVNHWPSRRGGEERSNPRRINAASTLKRYVDSLSVVRERNNFIIVGDFNDEPNNYSLNNILKAKKIDEPEPELINLSWDMFEEGIGTHLYNNEFNMLDQIIISNGFFDEIGIEYVDNSFKIVSDDFFTHTDGKKKGSIIPSFEGGKYIGGYADHLPVAARFFIVK